MRREIHPKLSKNVGAINSCRSSAVSLAGSSRAPGGAGHRAKPVLNALLNFTNLRRAVNHLGGSTRLGCSCRIWLAKVPAEFLRWDLSADPSFVPPVVLWITHHSNPDTRFGHSFLVSFVFSLRFRPPFSYCEYLPLPFSAYFSLGTFLSL